MKYHFIFLLFTILFFNDCRPKHNLSLGNNLQITQAFEIGKTYKYTIQKSKQKSEDTTSNSPIIINVSLKILSALDSLKLCSWLYGKLTILGLSEDRYSEDVVNIFNGNEIKFLMDSKGIFKEITNYENAKSDLENTFLRRGKLTEVDFDEEEYKKTIEAIKFTYATPELLINSYFQEIPLLFGLFGEIVHLDSVSLDSLAVTYEIYDAFNNGIEITKVAEINKPFIQIIRKTIFQKEALSAFFKNIGKKLSNKSSELKKVENLENGGMVIVTKFLYNYVEKIMTEVESTKTASWDQAKYQEVTKIKLVQ